MDDNFSVTGITCNPGYGPGNNIAATVCDSINAPYTLTGCTEMTCSGDGLNPHVDCGSGATCSDGSAGDGYTCSCGTGYTGADVSNGPATCIPTVCPTGQNIPNIFGPMFDGVQSLQGMSPNDQENNNPCRDTAVNTQCNLDFNPCPVGYIGGTITCQADGTWDVVNCEAVNCNSEPVITDQHMSIIAPEKISDATGDYLGRCRGANPGDICSHQCDEGYTGGSVTCERNGDTANWNIVACTETAPERRAKLSPKPSFEPTSEPRT